MKFRPETFERFLGGSCAEKIYKRSQIESFSDFNQQKTEKIVRNFWDFEI